MDYKKQRKIALVPSYECRVPCNLTLKERELLKKISVLEDKTMGSILQEAFKEYVKNYEIG